MSKHIYIFLYLVTLTYCEQNVTQQWRSLRAECTRAYYEENVPRRELPRNYYYYHEQLNPELLLTQTDLNGNIPDVDVKWRIVGGNMISITEAPYQVLYGRYCGGALIAPEWVLTAAHCEDKEKYVFAGSTERSKARKYKICAHFIHPLWKVMKTHTHDFDYQLALLETPIPVTASSRPIAIGTIEDIKPGDLVAVSGWGHLEFKQNKMQDRLRRVYVPVLDDEKCKSLSNGYFKDITPRMFCAGFLLGNKDACQGDSGGPAISHGRLVGLVSFGIGCAEAEKPGVYSQVPAARAWIRSVTALPL